MDCGNVFNVSGGPRLTSHTTTHTSHNTPQPQREWKELGRLIEEDRRLRDALKRRIQDTAAAAQQQKQQQQQQKAGVQPASSLLSLSPSGKGPLASGKDAGPQQQQQQQQQQQRVASPSPASSNPSGLLKV